MNPELLSAEARQQLESLQAEEIEFGEGDRAFDDIVADLLAAPLRVEMRRLTRSLRGELPNDDKERAYKRMYEIKAELHEIGSELARIGFKTTRYRAISRVRAEPPSPEQSE